jgi:hypothetical protein
MFWACHTLIWLNFVFYTACAFLEIFACQPISKSWDPLITTGQCLNVYSINIAAAAINTASDISILLLPQHVIWNLHMSVKKKLGVSAIFFTGIL